MKIQCSCGTKYSFEVTPEMVANPVKFVCQNCGIDNSASVNALVRQQAGEPSAMVAPPAAVAFEPAPAPVDASTGSRLKVSVTAPPAPALGSPAAAGPQRCARHPREIAVEHCVVCSKPICPQCMALFGYVCSPLCRNEAESRGIHVPVFAGQASAVQAADWRHFRTVTWGIAIVIAALIGAWAWYSASLSKPHPVFAVRFDDAAETGNARFITESDAIVLRGGKLVRYDVNGKKELWHSDLVDRTAIAQRAARIAAEEKAAYEKMRSDPQFSEQQIRRSQPENEADIARRLKTSAADAMQLYVRDSNVWVRSDEKMTRYDSASGKSAQEVALPNGYMSRAVQAGDAVVFFSSGPGGSAATRINLTSGQADTQEVADERSGPTQAVNKMGGITRGTNRATRTATGTVASSPPRPGGALQQFKTERDPSLAERIASPVVVATKVRNSQVEAAMADDSAGATAAAMETYRDKIVLGPGGKFIQCTIRLLEQKTVTRQAMKAAPKKSALDGNVNPTSAMSVANELANEWQRDRTGGVEKEDISRYEVTLRQFGASGLDWTGEVIGPPDFFSLQSVSLLVAGKTLQVFDQSNRKLWESRLNFELGPVSEGGDSFFGYGASAPGIEHGKDLLFRDAGVVTCFDLASGSARWRLPTVGASHLQFDDKGMLYVETTTASAEKLKYTLQVDVSKKDHPLVVKVDPANGKVLWISENNGHLAHIAGNIVYTLEWQGGVETGEENPYGIPGAYTPPHVRIRRLAAGTGKVAWEHYQRRGPLDVRFHGRTIEILFRKEFQVLRFWSL